MIINLASGLARVLLSGHVVNYYLLAETVPIIYPGRRVLKTLPLSFYLIHQELFSLFHRFTLVSELVTQQFLTESYTSVDMIYYVITSTAIFVLVLVRFSQNWNYSVCASLINKSQQYLKMSSWLDNWRRLSKKVTSRAKSSFVKVERKLNAAAFH